MTRWVDAQGTMHSEHHALVIVQDAPLGEYVLDPGQHPELGWRRNSLAYFCPTCGEVWARIVMTPLRELPEPFEVLSVACAEHRDRWNLPGSLLAGPYEALLALLPREAVLRELSLCLAQFEKELGR